MKKLASIITVSLFVTTFAESVFAVEPGREVAVKLTVQKVVRQADGSETLGKAEAGPGDTVEYKAVYTNEGKGTVRQLLATLPIPAPGMQYLPSSSSPANAEASVDGKTFALPPLKREVIAADGSRRTEMVPIADYRFLRWQVSELPAGKSFSVSSRMKLINEVSPETTSNAATGAVPVSTSIRQAGKP